jgi:hypothetical protein
VAARLTRSSGAALATSILVLLLAVGCAGSTPVVTASPSPSPKTTLAAESTRAAIDTALGARSIGVDVARSPFRPPESPLVAAAPRLVLEAFLPEDPQAGQIVVYEFPSAETAQSAGHEYARYIASGPGRVNFTPDTVFVLRSLGPTLIFSSYSPGSLNDPEAAAAAAAALTTVGEAIPIQG